MTIKYDYKIIKHSVTSDARELEREMDSASRDGYEEYQHPVACGSILYVFFPAPIPAEETEGQPYRQ